MTILSIRTDKPEAEVGLLDGDHKLAYETWQAHRELAETIHRKIDETLNKSSKSLSYIDGIIVFQGPGSFTGLRIGISVANALAYGLEVPIVGAAGDDWAEKGIKKLAQGANDKIVLPEYGGQAHITQPKR